MEIYKLFSTEYDIIYDSLKLKITLKKQLRVNPSSELEAFLLKLVFTIQFCNLIEFMAMFNTKVILSTFLTT